MSFVRLDNIDQLLNDSEFFGGILVNKIFAEHLVHFGKALSVAQNIRMLSKQLQFFKPYNELLGIAIGPISPASTKIELCNVSFQKARVAVFVGCDA